MNTPGQDLEQPLQPTSAPGTMRLRRCSGVSLIELMVAITIGSILISAAIAVFIESRETARINQVVGRIQENALFAADEITRGLELAGYWGQNNNSNLVRGRTTRSGGNVTASGGPAAANNCTQGAVPSYQWYSDLGRPIEGIDTNGETDANDHASYISCIPDSLYLRANAQIFGSSDILVVRYVDPNPVATASLRSGVMYVRSDPKQAELFMGDTKVANNNEPTGFDTSARNYQLRAYAYYISSFFLNPLDQIPTLKRVSLDANAGGTAPVITPGTEVVMQGVESLHVQFGIDTDGDGSANTYLNGTSVDPGVPAASQVSATQWNDVVAVRFWLVVRAEGGERNFNNTASYPLPIPQQANPTSLPTKLIPEDSFRRIRITRTVQIRNVEKT